MDGVIDPALLGLPQDLIALSHAQGNEIVSFPDRGPPEGKGNPGQAGRQVCGIAAGCQGGLAEDFIAVTVPDLVAHDQGVRWPRRPQVHHDPDPAARTAVFGKGSRFRAVIKSFYHNVHLSAQGSRIGPAEKTVRGKPFPQYLRFLPAVPTDRVRDLPVLIRGTVHTALADPVIFLHRLQGRPVIDQDAPVQDQDPAAEAGHGVQVMGDQQDCGPAGNLPDPGIAFLLEENIPYTQGLVDQQDLRLHDHSQGKCQADEHAGGVGTDRLADEIPDAGKVQNLLKIAPGLLPGHPHQESCQIDIFHARILGIETGAQFQQGGYPAPYPDLSCRRRYDPGQYFQQSGLAGSVPADDAHTFSRRDGKGYTFQGFKRRMVCASPEGKSLPDLICPAPVQGIDLPEVPDFYTIFRMPRPAFFRICLIRYSLFLYSLFLHNLFLHSAAA